MNHNKIKKSCCSGATPVQGPSTPPEHHKKKLVTVGTSGCGKTTLLIRTASPDTKFEKLTKHEATIGYWFT